MYARSAADRRAATLDLPPPDPADAGAIAGFLDAVWAEQGLARATLDSYRRDLEGASRWLQSRGQTLLGADRARLFAILEQRNRDAYAARSTARLLSALRAFHAWQVRRGARADDPTALLEAPRLPRSLEGRDLIVTGTIVDLPLKRDYASSFELRVDRATLDGRLIPWRGRVAASWYDDPPTLHPCGRWRLQLRLKRPRGLLDPGSADSERTALQRGIVAHGYVRDDVDNAQLGKPSWCVDGVRDAIARGIAARVRDPHDAALLRAFAVGDTRGLQQRDWAVARANGVSHLIAISGFHVGVAAVFGLGLATLLYGLLPRLGHRLPRPQA